MQLFLDSRRQKRPSLSIDCTTPPHKCYFVCMRRSPVMLYKGSREPQDPDPSFPSIWTLINTDSESFQDPHIQPPHSDPASFNKGRIYVGADGAAGQVLQLQLQEKVSLADRAGFVLAMATGRGWVRQQHIDQLCKQKPGPVANMATPTASSKPLHRTSYNTPKTFSTTPARNKHGNNIIMNRKSACKQSSYIDNLPFEIVLKIFSYLDVVSLLCIGSVNKIFRRLSNDNLLWYRIYFSTYPANKFSCKPNHLDLVTERLRTSTVEEKPPGYWKKTFISEMLGNRKKRISQILKSVKHSNGLPLNIEKAVKMSGLRWAITFKDRSGREYVIEKMDVFFRHTSLTLYWDCLFFPCLKFVTTVKLHGITPALLDKCMPPSKNGPQRLSLVAEYDLTDFKKASRLIGQDKLINILHLHPGLLLGVWKKSTEIAFVMATLHYHQILEISTLGSAERLYTIPAHTPILDDIDPNYGLHGYLMHIDLHSGSRTYMCGTFRNLFCKKDYIRDGFLRLSAIGMKNNKQHALLVGNVGLMWKTFSFEGIVENCLMMDVTVLDETEKPFWCISSPVSLKASDTSEGLFDFMGQSFVLNYKDPHGKVHIDLVWMKENKQYCIINLVLYLSTEKVNSWFGTNY
ncbi:F-box only protein 15 [Pelodytes ibericus]